MNARRDLYSAVMDGGLHSPDRSGRASELMDAFRADVLREAMARLNGVAESASEGKQLGLNAAVGVLLDMVTSRDKTPATAQPDFYEPGRTYLGSYGWKFRVDTITTRPEDGERTALGWRFFNGTWEPYAYEEGDWDLYLMDGPAATEGGAS